MSRSFPNPASLALRLVLGITFIMHGSQKLFGAFGGHGIAGTAAGFASLGLTPGLFWAWVVAITEFFGGLGMLGGLLTRLSALGVSIIMVVGIVSVHGKKGFFAQSGGYEYNLVILGAAVALLMLGAGAYSIEGYLVKRFRHDKQG